MKYPLTVVCLIALAVSAGCGVDVTSPVAPERTGGAPVVQSEELASLRIGPGGGSLSVGGVTLVVPARALTVSTLVTLGVTESAGTFHVTVEPTDQSLLHAATMTVPCSGSCRVLWLNPSSGIWEELASAVSFGGVEAKVIQFSRFDSEDTQ